jgi:hypothetical protein
MRKTPPIPPLFKAERPTLIFEASKDGKLVIRYQGWAENKVALGYCPN